MRTAAVLLAALTAATAAYGQAVDAPPPAPASSDSVAIGAVITPALEGGGPWFMPAVRLSAPLGSKAGLDLSAGRIFGGTNKYGEIRRFYAAQIRMLRPARTSEINRRYWFVGSLYLPITKLDGDGHVVRHKATTLLTLGHGWVQLFQNGARLSGELGLSAGDGFILHASAGVQWRPWVRRTLRPNRLTGQR